MFPAVSYERVIEVLTEGLEQERINSKFVGIVLARPELQFARKEILPHIYHWNNRSSTNIDFYFPGYAEEGAEGIPEKNPGEFSIGERNWVFSNILFNSFVRKLEGKSKYIPSGGVDLILSEVRIDGRDMRAAFVMDRATVLDLEFSVTKESVDGVTRFFEKIFDQAKSGRQLDTETIMGLLRK